MTDQEALIKYYGGRPQYTCGKLSKIGDRRVEYSFNRIFKIGTDRVEYSFDQISKVGGNRVQRSFGEKPTLAQSELNNFVLTIAY